MKAPAYTHDVVLNKISFIKLQMYFTNTLNFVMFQIFILYSVSDKIKITLHPILAKLSLIIFLRL